jgi:hypothetical protein
MTEEGKTVALVVVWSKNTRFYVQNLEFSAIFYNFRSSQHRFGFNFQQLVFTNSMSPVYLFQ